MEINAYQCIWYACPNCKCGNAVRLFDSYDDEKRFQCKQCLKSHTFVGLVQAYFSTHDWKTYGPTPPKDVLDVFCSEFTCRCGHVNHAFGVVTKTDSESLEQGWASYSETATTPEFGLCEECFAGYDLVYPEMDERIKLVEEEMEDNHKMDEE